MASGSGRNQPKHLKGREIDLRYAKKQKGKQKQRQERKRPTVSLKDSDCQELNILLDEMKEQYGEDIGRDHYRKTVQVCQNPLRLFENKVSWRRDLSVLKELKSQGSCKSSDESRYCSVVKQKYDSQEDLYERFEKLLRPVPPKFTDEPTTFGIVDGRPLDPIPMPADRERNQNLIKELEIKQQSVGYQKLLPFRQKLPAYAARDEILETIRNHRVTIIEGQTGCGKSTQIPQFVVDDRIMNGLGTETYVVCTQPRRIAATSLASRVADERSEVLGISVGYNIRFASELPRSHAALVYYTTGVLLRRLESDPQLKCISHLFLDEIHERELMSDFVMIVVKDLLIVRPDLRLILMSATIDVDSFARYFRKFNPAIKKIGGRLFHVEKFYLENVFDMLNYHPDPKNKAKSSNKIAERDRLLEIAAFCKKNLKFRRIQPALIAWNERDLDLICIVNLTKHICKIDTENRRDSSSYGAILIFLPGWDEISTLHKLMTKDVLLGDGKKFDLVPLHSMLPISDQKKVFIPAGNGRRKIILSTNISETSVTIDDVVYVIDSGKAKQSNFDHELNVSSLDFEWVSLMNIDQRRGRAGRCRNGFCFHLFPSYYEPRFEPRIKPEMLRTSVERLCLNVKLLKLHDSCIKFLSKSMDPPLIDTILSALDVLYDMGAMDQNENLTPLGVHLARLPLDPHLGKMLLYSVVFSCLDPVTTVAACLDFKDPFVTPLGLEKLVDQKKIEFCPTGSYSDYALWINVVHLWREKKSTGDNWEFARENFMSNLNLIQIEKLKHQFVQHLVKDRLISSEEEYSNQNSTNVSLVSAMVVAGLYPKIATIVRPYEGQGTSALCSTKRIEHVLIHRKSINRTSMDFPTINLIYHQCVKSKTVQIHDCAPVSPLTLMFFGNNLTYMKGKSGGRGTVLVDNFVPFNICPSTFKIILQLNVHLKKVFERFCQSPQTSFQENPLDRQLLNVVVRLLTEEKLY